MFRSLLLLFVPILLLGQEIILKNKNDSRLSLQEKKRVFSKNESLLYKKAVDFYKQRHYKKSYEIFSQLYLNHLSHIQINFYLGRSAFELKKYNQAYAAFQRILIQDEENNRVRLEMGRVLYVLKSYDEALKEFERVLKYPIPSTVRNNVQALISSIEDKKKKYFINGAFQFGLGHNDNVNSTTHLPYTTYGSTVLNNNTKKAKDSYNKLVLVLNLIVPFKKNKSLAYEGSLIGYSQDYFEENSSDLTLFSLSNGLSYIQNKYKLSALINTDKIWYGSDPLMTSIGITPKITYLYSKELIFNLSYKYSKKRMTKSGEEDKDANINNYTLGITKKLKNKASASLTSYFATERKVRGVRTDVDKDKIGYKISYGREFIPTINTVLSYAYDKNQYKQADLNFPVREDKSDTYAITFTKSMSKKSNITVEYNIIQNKSNIEANTYDRDTMGITYTRTF